MKIDKETIEKHRDAGRTLAETADILGVTYNSAAHYAKKYGITFRGNWQPEPKAIKQPGGYGQNEPKPKPTDKLTQLYRRVVEVRQHMRRLAGEEKYLLDAISKEVDG